MADNGVNPPGEAQFDEFEEVQAGVEPGGDGDGAGRTAPPEVPHHVEVDSTGAHTVVIRSV